MPLHVLHRIKLLSELYQDRLCMNACCAAHVSTIGAARSGDLSIAQEAMDLQDRSTTPSAQGTSADASRSHSGATDFVHAPSLPDGLLRPDTMHSEQEPATRSTISLPVAEQDDAHQQRVMQDRAMTDQLGVQITDEPSGGARKTCRLHMSRLQTASSRSAMSAINPNKCMQACHITCSHHSDLSRSTSDLVSLTHSLIFLVPKGLFVCAPG